MGIQDEMEIIPGTDVVFRGATGEAITSQELVLIPKPTNNPDDPLNWSPTWKTIVIFNQFLFVFVSILTPLAIAPLTEIFMLEFQKTLPEVNLLFGVAAIVLGWANFLIVPLANRLGRRPVILVCALICVLANVWQALVTSFPSFLAARVVSGLGAAANESLMPMVIADLLFMHQRGRSMALYFWAYFLGIFIGPIIAGSIAARMSWRWFFWICTILQAASFLFLVVAHPETKYDRPSALSEPVPIEAVADSDAEKTAGAATKDYSEADETTVNMSDGLRTSSSSIASAALRTRPIGGPSRAQLMPINFETLRSSAPRSSMLRDATAPLRIFAVPIVLWVALTFGFACNCLLALNLTESQVFAAPPYNFNPAQIGLTNLAFFVGAAIALATAGPLSDWVALRGARRNGGVMEAEMRLVATVPYIAVCLVGMVVTAVGYQRGWPWQVIVVLGYGLVGIEVVGLPAILIAYATDSYKSLPGEIMIAATVIKNSFGFAMVFFFNDWAARQGFIAPVLMLMAVTVGLSVLGLAVFIPFGKRFRRATKDSSLHIL